MQRKSSLKRLLAWSIALFLLFSTQGVSASFLSAFLKTEDPLAATTEPPVTVMLKTETLPRADVPAVLLCEDADRDAAAGLYDGDNTTLGGAEKPLSVTLDLGQPRRLSGVRFQPKQGDVAASNRCVGTRFLVSNNNKTFYHAASIEPIDGGDYPDSPAELAFGSSGEYRYVRAEIPAGAYFAELSWLELSGWQKTPAARGRSNFDLEVTLANTKEAFSATILAAVYNKNGVLQQLVSTEQEIPANASATATLQLPNLRWDRESTLRIPVFSKDGATLLKTPPVYRDNGASQVFSVSNLFSDDMLLQAEKPLSIWGTAPTGSRISVTIENQNGGRLVRHATVRSGSEWEVSFGRFSPGGSYRMTVQCGTLQKVFQNLTFGDLWLCIGQSNMDYYMLGGKDTEAYLASDEGMAEAENPNIRLLNLWNLGLGGAGAPVTHLPLPKGRNAWATMSRDTANYCSAVGYYFSQELEKTYQIPIGLLSVAVGDTEINRWIPRGETYQSFTSTDGGLFYNRVAPFSKLQIRGILMYQGEADQYRTALTTTQYRDALAGLVDRYREIWGRDLPFYWAQLTRYKKDESAVREGQRLALTAVQNPKNTGMISLIDLYGEYESGAGNCREDIHPHQKKVVAERFLRYAKRDVYGEKTLAVSGPLYQSMRIAGNTLELTFACTGALSVLPEKQYADRIGHTQILKQKIDTSRPQEFEIAGADGIFYPATATLRGNTVLLVSPQVSSPVAARYAWGAYPEFPNLTDESGLPAPSFCTIDADFL